MSDIKQNENEQPDAIELRRLLEEAKPIVIGMYPDERRKWVAESPLARDISAILARHPEYYDQFRGQDGGIFSEFKPRAARA
ncbi:MAG: hypothetical protein ACLQMT_02930 [Candidatus Acidiferrales bacterium]